MFERFTHPAHQCVIQAHAEARSLCHSVIDGKHLLLGLMRVPNGVAAAVLAGTGLSYGAVRTAVIAHDKDQVDPESLRSLGINLDAVREAVEDAFGEGALERAISDSRANGGPGHRSPRFTPAARKILELALREALGLGHRSIGTEHILLGLLREAGAGADVLHQLAPNLDLRHLVMERLRDAS